MSLPPKIYGNGCSTLNNTRPTHLKEENELKLQGLFLLLSNNKLRCQINGGNQLIVNWMIKIQSESFQWPYEWWLKKHLITPWLAMESFRLSWDWGQKPFGYHRISYRKNLVTTTLAIKKIWSLILDRWKSFSCQSYGDWIHFWSPYIMGVAQM